MSVVELHNLTKNYGDVQALKGIDLQINEGEIFGLIGPDGAGKTTLFRILTTLLLADEGEVNVLNLDVVKDYAQIRKKLGYMPGRFSLYEDLSVVENMEFFASVFGTSVDENYELVAPIYSQLEPFKHRLAGQLSGGMKQKLALSCALIHKPELLVLDEPTTGVDAVSRTEFWEMLLHLKSLGISMVVSTPYMDEAKRCDRVGLMDKGEILTIGTPNELTKSFQQELYGVTHPDKHGLIKALHDYEYAASVQPFGAMVHYTDQRGRIEPRELSDYLSMHQFEHATVEEIEAGIEDLFIKLMQPEQLDG
jgi:ABC-type multidrug transport system ATPase subunit